MKNAKRKKMFKQKESYSVKSRVLEYPDGLKIKKKVIIHSGTSIAIPVLENGSILLIKQYRPVIGQWSIEAPGGVREKEETPEETVSRELLEELGARVGKLIAMRDFFATVGYSTEKIYLFVALNMKFQETNRHPTEFRMELIELRHDEIHTLLSSSDIIDSKTIIALHEYLNWYNAK